MPILVQFLWSIARVQGVQGRKLVLPICPRICRIGMSRMLDRPYFKIPEGNEPVDLGLDNAGAIHQK